MAEFTSLDYAMALHRLGLSIVPVPRPGGSSDGKRPVISWKPYQTERASEERIREWFATEQNVAIITGAVSSVVVVDTDAPDAEEWARLNLPRTPWRVKTSKGFHRFYRHPGETVTNRARIATQDGRLALDVRGDGGFVIGPGSIHASGAKYTALGDWSIPAAKLPAFWLGWIAKPRPPQPPRSRAFLSGDGAIRARAYLAKVPRPVIGQGSDHATFAMAARIIHDFGLTPQTAAELLQEWCPEFDRSWIERKTTNALTFGGKR